MILSTRGVFRLALVVAALGSFCGDAHAQTGACPTNTAVAINPGGWVAITPDIDYLATHTSPIDGTTIIPNVVRLDLLLFDPTKTNTATDGPTQTLNLGKPARNAQGCVWVQVPAITAIPFNQQYKARAVSVGQPLTAGGAAQVSARSPESNPFLRLAPSPAPLAPSAVSVPAS